MTLKRGIYCLTRKWTSAEYVALVDAALTHCTGFILVTQHVLEQEGVDILNRLEPFLLETRQSMSWPGTRLLGRESANLYKYRLVLESAEILRGAVNSLWDWSGQDRPEDLSFIRETGVPWFILTTHEKDAYFVITEDEKAAVESAFGPHSLRCECADACLDEVY